MASGWYRTAVLPFQIESIHPLDDSTVILWDGRKNNYTFSLRNKELQGCYASNPYDDFLRFPIKQMNIRVYEHGCTGTNSLEITYDVDTKGILRTNAIKRYYRIYSSSRKATPDSIELYQNQCQPPTSLLHDINNNATSLASIKDFKVSTAELERLIALMEKRRDSVLKLEVKNAERVKSDIEKIDFLLGVLHCIDTLSDSTLAIALSATNLYQGFGSVTSSVCFVNSNSDSLEFSAKNSYSSRWKLPWVCTYHGISFRCYNVQLWQYMSTLLPKRFYSDSDFTKEEVIHSIMEYLLYKRSLLEKQNSYWLNGYDSEP